MSFLDLLRGRPAARSGAPASQHPASGFHESSAHTHAASSGLVIHPNDPSQQFPVRRDLLKLVLRDLMTRNAIPTAWLEVRPMAALTRQRTQGVHGRLVIKHWQPLLLEYAPQLEQQFIQRLMAMDPLADQWLLGLSWQLELPEGVELKPLPRAGTWTAAPRAPHAQQAAPARPEGADVIEGPVHIAPSTGSAKHDLDRLLAEGDERTRRMPRSFDATQPAGLN